jgi:DNA modification methylase
MSKPLKIPVINELIVEMRPIDELKPNPQNARTHSTNQVLQLARSIDAFGFNTPVVIDDRDMVLAGHGRIAAAKHLGHTAVPTIRVSQMTKEMKRAYVIADNKIAENAGWNRPFLAIELDYLLQTDTTFDLSTIGFELSEATVIIDEAQTTNNSDIDNFPAACLDQNPTSQLGDRWRLDDHQVMCGNALERSDINTLMAGETTQMVFTDPPYNVVIKNTVGKGRNRYREFPMASGELNDKEFTKFLYKAFEIMKSVSSDGALHFVCMDWRHAGEMLDASRSVYAELKNICVWDKGHGGMGSLYRSQHEFVFVFKVDRCPHINNIDLGRYGRNRTNIWRYSGNIGFGHSRDESAAAHPTVKPAVMIADAMMDCSRRGDLILDPFGGSGSTIIAAHKTGRRAYLMELDPLYVDATIRRWQVHTGHTAVHASTGTPFDELEARRNSATQASEDTTNE